LEGKIFKLAKAEIDLPGVGYEMGASKSPVTKPP
jgi:hypothetical protein